MEKKNKYCPTQSGTYVAYQPEYLNSNGEWESVPVKYGECGIPQPMLNGGINVTLSLHGYAQAKALAWMWAAFEAAKPRCDIKVRVQAYEVEYDLKAKKIDLPDKKQ